MAKGANSKEALFVGTGWAVWISALILLTGLAMRKWGGDLSAWGSFLTGGGTIGLVAGAVYAAAVAARDYRRKVDADERRGELEKAKWLAQLFERFYESPQYKEVRRRVDYGEIEDLLSLITKDKVPNATFSMEEQIVFDQFTDYLNLFEFVAYLRKLDQLDSEDIKAMFAYYLERLIEVDTRGEIRAYIRDNGYGNFDRLLSGYTK
jgi:hypothetical protein